jgi:putative glutamine amidotransferase
MNKPVPLVWLPADHRLLGGDDNTMPFLVLGDKYARALKVNAQVQPVLFPLADAHRIDALLDLVDGVMLTGSPSNVHPSHFGAEVTDPCLPLDPERDALTLNLVRNCLQRNIPLLGICRGFQEINVALGGSLHQQVQDLPGHLDHRHAQGRSYDEQYGLAHDVRFVPGSSFAKWAGADVAKVNSLHGQGIDRLAPGLRAVGYAPDGLVEAFEVEGAHTFACAVQWHPEWRTSENAFFSEIFQAFGAACRARQGQRKGALEQV